MYNLVVGCTDGIVPNSRMLEGITLEAANAFGINLQHIPARLEAIPTLLAPEIDYDLPADSPRQIARFGRAVNLRKVGLDWKFDFIPNGIPAVPISRIIELADPLDIYTRGYGDFGHTAWTIRSPDLYQVLLEHQDQPETSQSSLKARPEAGRIAMMMPFTPVFDRVWETVKGLADERGWLCDRADTVWEHDQIMDDVFELITRAQVIVCDISGHNPNVMYEVGLAHGLGQQILPIAQSGADALPFDLSSYRTTFYVNNGEGMVKLREAVIPRLDRLMSKPASLSE